MPSTVVIGGFFGDEGKGKIISYLALHDKPTIVVRGGAGPNAGHTIKDDDKTYKVRMLPSGFLNKEAKVMIGPGVVVNPEVLLKEINDFGVEGRAFLDNNCGIIEQSHREKDSQGRLKEKIGSTGSGKTTLLRMLAGLEIPSEGTIKIDGIDMTEVPPYKRPVNIMFQNYALFPHLNCLDNVAFPQKIKGISKEKRYSAALKILEMVQMNMLMSTFKKFKIM